MKRYKCECEYAFFPFGPGAPVCLYDKLEKGENCKIKACVEKGCEKYKKKAGATE